MNPRYRSARFAALALALATPLVAASAAPAFADGESTTAVLTSPQSGSATTFTWDYVFHQDVGHGLSNVAIGFCSADILADVDSAGPSAEIFTSDDVPGGHTGFGPGIKFGVTATTGTLTVTFKNPHPISNTGLRIQSHSGDGQDGDSAETAKGPGPCPGDPTDEVIEDEIDEIDEVIEDGDDDAPVTNTDPAPTTVLPLIVETSDAPPPAAPIAVLGETLVAGGELPRTGASQVEALVALGFGLVAAGAFLRMIFSRRERSTFSPG